MEIPILYEDKDILAVNKPAGLMVHPDGRSKGPFLTDWIIENYPKTKNVGEFIEVNGNRKGVDEKGVDKDCENKKDEDKNNLDEKLDKKTEKIKIERPGIVHRLDRDTSGIILIAKTKKGFECLKKQFQDKTITKKYLAFVYGEIKDKYGIINRPIGRSPKDFRRWSATRGARGEMREAETWYTVLANKDGFSLLEVEPKTGRTHQIRVHFKAINHPIVHDELYASDKISKKISNNTNDDLGFKRNALHSYSIEFINCADKKILVKASTPDDFKNALGKIGSHHLLP